MVSIIGKGSDGQRLAEFGNDGLPAELIGQPVRERLLRFVLAVDQIDRLGFFFATAQPDHELAGIGVGRQTADLRDVGLDRDPLAVDLDLGLTLHETPALGALGLIADKDHGVSCVWEPELEVVQNPTTGGHPGGGDDDRRSAE